MAFFPSQLLPARGASGPRLVSGSVRTLMGLNGTSTTLAGTQVQHSRIRDRSNVRCRRPVLWTLVGRVLNLNGAGLETPASTGSGATLTPAIGAAVGWATLLTGISGISLNQSAATAHRATYFRMLLDPQFVAAGGTVAADGLSYTLPPNIVITSITSDGNGLATALVDSTTMMRSGETWMIGGATPTAYDQTNATITVINDRQFTFAVTTGALADATGTLVMNKAWPIRTDPMMDVVLEPGVPYYKQTAHKAAVVGNPAPRNIFLRADLGDASVGTADGGTDWTNAKDWSAAAPTQSLNNAFTYSHVLGYGD